MKKTETSVVKKEATVLSQDFYRDVKNLFQEFSDTYGDSFSRLSKTGKIVPGKRGNEEGPELYFINIDKLMKLSFHDVKFLLDNMLFLAHSKLQEDTVDKVNFCSLVFEKVKPNKRGLQMLKLKNIKTPPAKKMKVGLKKKDFIKLTEQ